MESLRPNRDLLDPKFEGYKLSLEPLTLSSTNLVSAVNDTPLREELFSFQHMRAFGNLNHLVLDSWLDGGKHEVIYFVNENCEVQRASLKVSRNEEITVKSFKLVIHYNLYDNGVLGGAGGNLLLVGNSSSFISLL